MTSAPFSPLRLIAVLVVAALWLGMLLGVSFLATPAKFLAPTLTLPVALDVGRHTFMLFNKIECVLAFVLLLLVGMRSGGWALVAAAMVAAALVVASSVWLLPALDARAEMVIAGQPLSPSLHHRASVAVEGAKLLILLFVIVIGARRLLRSTQP